jgi:hypothetical protein
MSLGEIGDGGVKKEEEEALGDPEASQQNKIGKRNATGG